MSSSSSLSSLEGLTRDEEGNELSDEYRGQVPRVFTCCVGKTLSQAEFKMSDSTEVAGLLDLLANVSADEKQIDDADEAASHQPQLHARDGAAAGAGVAPEPEEERAVGEQVDAAARHDGRRAPSWKKLRRLADI